MELSAIIRRVVIGAGGMPYNLVIFDMDGTLTHDALDFDSLRLELGLTERVPILEWIDTLPEPRRARSIAVLERYENMAAEKSTLRPGARDLLCHLRGRNIRSALLTRNSGKSMNRIVARCDLAFDLAVSRDQPPFKPHPESIGMILRKLNAKPTETLMVGDYIFDLQAAAAAGVESVLLLDDPQAPPAFAHQATFHVSRLDHIIELIKSPGQFRVPAQSAGGTQRSLTC